MKKARQLVETGVTRLKMLFFFTFYEDGNMSQIWMAILCKVYLLWLFLCILLWKV